MKITLIALAVFALLCWRFPLFRIVPLAKAQAGQPAAFDAAKAAADFWSGKLLPAAQRAVEVNELLAALANDPAAARRQHGRTLGLGSPTLFLTRGSGKITTVSDESLVIALDHSGMRVTLQIGPLFGNAVRDCTGLLDVSAYPNSQDFNELATQLNGLVETKVVATARPVAVVGKAVRFAGCFELDEDARPEAPAIIPVTIEWP